MVGRQATKPNFSRLATDCSDEILDFDDDHNPGSKPSPPTSLGKRNKPDTVSPKPVSEQGAPKPYKRLVSSPCTFVSISTHKPQRASTRRTGAAETDAGTGSKKVRVPHELARTLASTLKTPPAAPSTQRLQEQSP